MGPPTCFHRDDNGWTAEDTGQCCNETWSGYVARLGKFHACVLAEMPLMGSVFVMRFHDGCAFDVACAPVPWLPELGLLCFAAAGAGAGALLWVRSVSHPKICP